MKTILLSILCLSASVHAQEVISSQGESYTNSEGSIDFTIGEPITYTASDGTNDLTQGFHQTNWNFVSLENLDAQIDVSVYPNPVTFNLIIETDNFQGLTYRLLDYQGRLVFQGELNEIKTCLDATDLTTGTYILGISTNDKTPIKNFTLQKLNN